MAGCNDADVTASRDPLELLVAAKDEFAQRMQLVGPDDWRDQRRVPSGTYTRWSITSAAATFATSCCYTTHPPTEQVETTRTVDHLGDDALASFVATADGIVVCFHEDGALERIAHHATGDRTGRELLSMRILDAAIHGWDLARAIGGDETLDGDVVAFLLAYTAELDLGPQQRAFARADAHVPRNASPQDQLLHRLGRHPTITEEVR